MAVTVNETNAEYQKHDESIPTVDHLNQSLSCILQVDISKYMNPVTKVLGRVDTVSKPYGKYVYISLRGNDSTMSVKCPASQSPQSGQDLIFEGRVGLKVNKIGGFSVELSGRPVQKVQPFVNDKAPVYITKERYVPLYSLLNTADFKSIAVIGSNTALRDVRTALDDCFVERGVCFYEVSTVSKSAVFGAVLKASKSHTGVMVVRGGDDDTLDIWDEPEFVKSLVDINTPFYLGLGHSHKMTLANQYADESVPTPSAGGARLNGILLGIRESVSMREELIAAKQSVDKQIRAAVIKSLMVPVALIVLLSAIIFNMI